VISSSQGLYETLHEQEVTPFWYLPVPAIKSTYKVSALWWELGTNLCHLVQLLETFYGGRGKDKVFHVLNELSTTP
jgi:hypothetical protein